jgi:plastocyanin
MSARRMDSFAAAMGTLSTWFVRFSRMKISHFGKMLAAVLSFAALVCTSASGRAPASPEPEAVTIVATEYAFSPAEIHVAAGQPLRLTLVNKGKDVRSIRFTLSYGELPFATSVPPGQSATEVLSDLGDPGRYRFYCPMSEHRERGMSGVLVISGPPA